MPFFFKMHQTNFVPMTRTPWGGEQISLIKNRYRGCWGFNAEVPSRIGESWEVSTDMQFPSYISVGSEMLLLEEVLQGKFGGANATERILGRVTSQRYGAHSPLLLKWIEADTLLSAQVHPRDDNPLLRPAECGKPEAWLVLAVKPGAFIYLGFKSGISKEDIIAAVQNDDLVSVLHRIEPKPFDYISIPPGCVHALGPGVLVAEPQCVLPGKSGKTWRLSDWKRRYNSKGEEDPAGQPRELHRIEALSAIDWSLPRGREVELLLVRGMGHRSCFEGDRTNPCRVHLLCEPGTYKVFPLAPGEFMLATMWQGGATIKGQNGGETASLCGGESLLIGAEAGVLDVVLRDQCGEAPQLAFFGYLAPV